MREKEGWGRKKNSTMGKTTTCGWGRASCAGVCVVVQEKTNGLTVNLGSGSSY